MKNEDLLAILHRVANGLSTAQDAAVLAKRLGVEWLEQPARPQLEGFD